MDCWDKISLVMYQTQEYSGAKHRSLTLFLVFQGLLHYILIDGLFSQSRANTSDEVSCHPDLTTPVVLLQELIFSEKQPGGD